MCDEVEELVVTAGRSPVVDFSAVGSFLDSNIPAFRFSMVGPSCRHIPLLLKIRVAGRPGTWADERNGSGNLAPASVSSFRPRRV